jgi:quinol monooxygenase YgiN
MPAVKTHVTYRPKKGKEEELLALVRKHGPALESTGLITGGAPMVYRARNIRTGETSFVEIFSWRDEKASGLAHQTPEVMAVWEPMTPLLEGLELNVIEPLSGEK